MADLSVNAAELDAIAASGADMADLLVNGSEGGGNRASQPSHAGVAAIRESVTTARRAQSARGIEHADRIQAASAVYRRTDDGSAASITKTI
ncbi:hypothetical protein FR943_08805 [Mycobacterium sp. TNTM28]|uniref:ESX-1 secretion-associated protein n=1 Tax=[Mycobacterium] fortunisiensis TaxID=2600579 RepID=A0ABS6KK90_9MYCO|nr:hypothetical protein [[Mycobacterium] fortunisiensis]MBU9763940.1 hypothetical protein [[Mycobacterium] fortunisiensis]